MKEWEKQEELVKLIEKMISPSSTVERNVMLPNLSSPSGAKCQCDVVIRNGQIPRETISIVEIQKRGTKVDINTFRGWCEKMKDVGAQHLICVSEKGFPESIVEKAKMMGPTIRLLTLAQLKANEKWPINFLSNKILNPRRELTKITDARLDYKNDANTNEDLEIKIDSKDFTYNGIELSAKELYFSHLDYLEGLGNIFSNGKHIINMKLPLDGDKLCYSLKGELIEVINFSASYEVDILNREIELISLEYKQIDYGSTMAWIMKASIYLNDIERELKFIIVPDNNAFYRLAIRIDD